VAYSRKAGKCGTCKRSEEGEILFFEIPIEMLTLCSFYSYCIEAAFHFRCGPLPIFFFKLLSVNLKVSPKQLKPNFRISSVFFFYSSILSVIMQIIGVSHLFGESNSKLMTGVVFLKWVIVCLNEHSIRGVILQ